MAGASAVLGKYGVQIAAAALLFGAASAAGLARMLRERKAALNLCILASTVGLVTLAAVLKIKVLNARYLMCAFPVFIAVVAHGIPRRGWGRYAAAAALCVLMLVERGLLDLYESDFDARWIERALEVEPSLYPARFAQVQRSRITWANLPPAFVYRCRR